MNNRIIRILPLVFLAVLSQGITSCDDGHVDDPVYVDDNNYYNVMITGNFTHLKTWSGDYSVAAGTYDDESEYSLVQKVLPSTATDTSIDTLYLSNVPVTSKTVEIAVVNRLRMRIATLYSYAIPDNQRYDDTIRIDVGTLNVGMFGAINKYVFQNTSVNCSRCHASAESTANLDLTEANAYAALVNVQSHTNDSLMRVKPGDADNSYLYKAIMNEASEIHYNHNGLFSDIPDFLNIIKSWINSGAKE